VKRNQIFDNRASARYTVAGLVATLPEGKKSDLFGASGADDAFLSSLQTGGGKSDPVLGVRLGPFKAVEYLDGRNPRPRHGRKPDTIYAATFAAPLSGDLGFWVIEAGLSGCRPWWDPTGCKTSWSDEGLREQRG
jgi:hypothetical protein